MIKCLVIDDDFVSKSILNHYCEENPNTVLIDSYTSAIEALKSKHINEVDIIFTDIEMPECDGIEFVKRLKNNSQIVFTTTHQDYALEAFNHNVLDFLVKPIEKERFNKSVDKYITIKGEEEEPISFRVNRRNVNIAPSKIKYFESFGDYIKIFCEEEVMVIHSTMKELESSLPENFLRTHRKYIVNKNRIQSFNSTDLDIEGIKLPIGKSYKDILIS